VCACVCVKSHLEGFEKCMRIQLMALAKVCTSTSYQTWLAKLGELPLDLHANYKILTRTCPPTLLLVSLSINFTYPTRG